MRSTKEYNTARIDKLVCDYNHNQKALLELPTEIDSQRLYAIDDDINFDSFKFWYKRTVITFAEQKPLFTKNHAPKSHIHTKIFNCEGSIVFYKGELNDNGVPHGFGLMIKPFKMILESKFKNLQVQGESTMVDFNPKPQSGTAKI